MSIEDFRRQFEYLVGYEPPPLVMDAGGEAGEKERLASGSFGAGVASP
jgi:hypothetical protein